MTTYAEQLAKKLKGVGERRVSLWRTGSFEDRTQGGMVDGEPIEAVKNRLKLHEERSFFIRWLFVIFTSIGQQRELLQYVKLRRHLVSYSEHLNKGQLSKIENFLFEALQEVITMFTKFRHLISSPKKTLRKVDAAERRIAEDCKTKVAADYIALKNEKMEIEAKLGELQALCKAKRDSDALKTKITSTLKAKLEQIKLNLNVDTNKSKSSLDEKWLEDELRLINSFKQILSLFKTSDNMLAKDSEISEKLTALGKINREFMTKRSEIDKKAEATIDYYIPREWQTEDPDDCAWLFETANALQEARTPKYTSEEINKLMCCDLHIDPLQRANTIVKNHESAVKEIIKKEHTHSKEALKSTLTNMFAKQKRELSKTYHPNVGAAERDADSQTKRTEIWKSVEELFSNANQWLENPNLGASNFIWSKQLGEASKAVEAAKRELARQDKTSASLAADNSVAFFSHHSATEATLAKQDSQGLHH